ncbi:dienelactone hydrolase family protein [Micropruina sp.]|uniref:dienelactone hydrolase family protein n=1 Tax=Micropruina sp. TaxID=2737536 RepID=UPI0039E5FC23
MLQITTADGTAEAIVASAPGGGPGVLLFMDAFGLRPRIQQIAERIAGWGYVVLAPNVFYRAGTVAEFTPPGDIATPEGMGAFFQTCVPRMGHLTTELAERDFSAYLDALRAVPGVRPGPIGTVGFCMGGRYAVRLSGALPDDVAACAALHTASLVGDEDDSPHLALATARAQYLFANADNDAMMTPDNVKSLDQALQSAGLSGTNVIVPNAAHGYTMSDTAAWNADATEWAFGQLRDLFARTLGSGCGTPD